MAESKTYQGGCHCGAVRFEFSSDLSRVTACNCSICARAGWVLTFVPGNDFKLLSGQQALTDYQFGKRNIHHLFCKTCGVRSFSRSERDGKKYVAVNLRCVDGVDAFALSAPVFNGKDLPI